MKVRIKSKDKIIIIPETDFEEEFLRDGNFNRWLKQIDKADDVNEVVGLVVEHREGAFGPHQDEDTER